jgi:cold shock CspA family protein
MDKIEGTIDYFNHEAQMGILVTADGIGYRFYERAIREAGLSELEEGLRLLFVPQSKFGMQFALKLEFAPTR